MKIARILFPTDFSKYSESARDYSIYLSQKLESPVYILHAIEPLEYSEVDEEIKAFYTELKIQVEEKMNREREHFDKYGIETHINFVIGPSWRVINTYAKEKEIDLIIMGSHGLRTEKGDLSIGTTSHKVMLTSPCPVLLIKENQS